MVIPLLRGVDFSPGCVNMKSKILSYNPKLKQTAAKLRKQGIISEVL